MKLAIPCSLAALALAACADNAAPLSPDFGEAVRNNMAVHIINPAPDYGTEVPATSGAALEGPLGDYYGTETAPPPPAPIVLAPATTGG